MTAADANAEFLAGVGGEYIQDADTGNLTRPPAAEPPPAPPVPPAPSAPSRPRS
jgi:hypothetical protein